MKIVIIGAGEVGFHIANRLTDENKDVVVVDKSPEAIQKITNNIDAQGMVGSGSSPLVLEDAGVREAEIMLAVTDSDEINLSACLITNILSPSTRKIARIRNADFDNYHTDFKEKAPHINTVINPEIEVVKTIDRLLSVPGAVDIDEFANGRVKFVGVNINQECKICGARLKELPNLITGRKPLIVAIVRNEKLIIPGGDDQLFSGDVVYFICEDYRLKETLEVFDKHAEPLKRVLIVGGGNIGYRLAKCLEEKSIATKLIEKDPDRCGVLAEHLNKVVVLHGDGSDQEILAEENIKDMDFVVTLTNDEETNILVSLLAKRMGTPKTITKISKFSYLPLMAMIGIEQVVSPRLSAINSILQHIRRGKILSAKSIAVEQAEVIEAVALETSDIVGVPLHNLNFPKGAILGCIIRGADIIIPKGESIIEPEDRIIIFAQRSSIPKVEKFLTVKLEFF